MPRKKVLYVITKADTGGAQKYVADLSAGLDPTRFEAKILYGERDLRWLSNRTLPWFLFANDWLAVFELISVFRRERPDVIHLNSSKAGVTGSLASGIYKISCRLSRVACPKIIFTAHGWVFNPTNYHSSFARAFYIVLHRIAARFCDVIVNVSDHDRCLAIAYEIAPVRKLITIHNGIDPNIPFLSREVARKEILARLEIRDSRLEIAAHPWVGSVGRLVKEKDYGTLIAAASALPDVHFFIIGAGPEESNLKYQVSTLALNNRFFLISPTGNDARLFKAFDVFALPSIKEGLPYTLLEAIAAGIPAVVTDAGGMPEVIRKNKNGRVVPRRNPNALAEALRAALASAPVAPQSVTPPFTAAAMRAATETLYDKEN